VARPLHHEAGVSGSARSTRPLVNSAHRMGAKAIRQLSRALRRGCLSVVPHNDARVVGFNTSSQCSASAVRFGSSCVLGQYVPLTRPEARSPVFCWRQARCVSGNTRCTTPGPISEQFCRRMRTAEGMHSGDRPLAAGRRQTLRPRSRQRIGFKIDRFVACDRKLGASSPCSLAARACGPMGGRNRARLGPS
jgi:hypothetical protein